MSNLIKKFNVTINGSNPETYEVGADAKNVQFSDEATSPFTNETVEDNVPVGIVEKAENRIYGNAYIKNNDWDDIEGAPEDFGPIDDINPDRRTEGAGALTITYGFNSLAKGHHSTAIGFGCEANGWASHAEGWQTTTGFNSNYAHAEGGATSALHNIAHSEGDGTIAAGHTSHAEGSGTQVYGVGSHSEGITCVIGKKDAIAWQNSNSIHQGNIEEDMSNNNDFSLECALPKQYINGQFSHAEGRGNIIYGACCHAEGMGNTIFETYASTAMGEENKIYSNTSVAMGSANTLRAGADNSLILGTHNDNPGYPNSLFLGQYCSIGSEESQSPALVIGSGDENTPSNLMTIRHPQTGAASQTNKGDLWAENLDAHFGNNKWISATYEAISDNTHNIIFKTTYSQHSYTAKKLRVIVWLNEFNQELKVTVSPTPEGWIGSAPDEEAIVLTTLSGRYLKDYFKSESERGAKVKIENAINNLKYPTDIAACIHEDTGNPLTVAKVDVQKLFSTSVSGSIRIKYMSGPTYPANAHPFFRYSFIY